MRSDPEAFCGRLYENLNEMVSGAEIDRAYEHYPTVQQPVEIDSFPCQTDPTPTIHFGWRTRHAKR